MEAVTYQAVTRRVKAVAAQAPTAAKVLASAAMTEPDEASKEAEPSISSSYAVPDAEAEKPGPPPGSAEAEFAQARHWIKNVYKGDKVPQLTFRAVVTGMVLGGVMALSNLYVGFKTGWGLGVTITACILAFALFSALQRVFPGLRRNEFTILENNMMSSTASAAGYMSSSIFVGAVPALYLAAGKTIGCWSSPSGQRRCPSSGSSWRSR
ncbi:MAG: OPT/YSL family transporter [Deltaproteobacteria bacterium]|nr:OPT/YSL family transporter [Deltaproteobacteria bacterium]